MKRILLALICLFVLLYSQPVQVWISDCAADSGATFSVPIQIDTVTGRGIIGVDITLTFRAEVLVAESIWTGNVVPSGWLIYYNATNPGELIIAMAGAEPLSGAGTLCTLKFMVSGSPGDTTTIHFLRCQLNEGSVPCTTDDGLFTVVSVEVKENGLGKLPFQVKINPNPFQNYTDISYQLTKRSLIRVSVYDALGEKLVTLIDTKQEPRLYSTKWHGRKENGMECKKGIYYLIMENNNRILKRKLIKI